MAIPSKQIGWSQRSNLLWEISNQLDKTLGFMCTGPCPTPPPPPTTTTTSTTMNTNMSLKVPYDSGPRGDYFNIPAYNPLDDTGNFTIEWWAKITSDDNHPRAWSIGNFYDGAASAVSIENGIFYYWIAGTIISSFDMPSLGITYLNTWTNFCIMRDSYKIYFFVNGVPINLSVEYLGGIPTNSLPLYIGSEGVESLQNGLMSNFRWTGNGAIYPNTGFTPDINDQLVSSGRTKLLILQGVQDSTDITPLITDNSSLAQIVENGTGTSYSNSPYIGVGTYNLNSILFGVAPT